MSEEQDKCVLAVLSEGPQRFGAIYERFPYPKQALKNTLRWLRNDSLVESDGLGMWWSTAADRQLARKATCMPWRPGVAQ